jgi:hypothetical protein
MRPLDRAAVSERSNRHRHLSGTGSRRSRIWCPWSLCSVAKVRGGLRRAGAIDSVCTGSADRPEEAIGRSIHGQDPPPGKH